MPDATAPSSPCAGQPLAGRTIVVTRPQAQARGLADAIRDAGGTPLIFPLLEILPAADPAPLAAVAPRLGEATLAIFISPNAVDHALPVLLHDRPWPAGVTPAAVGQGTIRALQAHGVTGGIAPRERFDSEALLALPALAADAVSGRTVFIFRGDGGRELLADTLRARGANVECIPCYRRQGPSHGAEPLLAAWRAGRLDALTISSSEGLRYLVDLLDAEGQAHLRATPLFVPHARIAETAAGLGLARIILTEGADDGLLRGLRAYNW